MTAKQNCPLNSDLFLQSARPMGLSHLQDVENHVNSGVNNCPHPPLKELILDGRVKGTTPLLLACHWGEFDSVKHIVESWGVDVRSAATYYMRLLPFPISADAGRFVKIESATPLFVAAFQGHSKIVRYLLEKGADVTAKTSSKARPQYDGLSPLNGAVSEHWTPPPHRQPLDKQRAESNAIVQSLLEFGADLSDSYDPNGKPIWMYSNWCGVDMTITLINHGLDVNQRDPTSRRTILHHWANTPRGFTVRDSLKIVKLLFKKGADMMAKDIFGFTPIMTAANGLNSRLNLNLLDFFLERDDITIMEKIEAMELAGANILFFCRSNDPQFPKVFEYWRRATHLRQTKGSGSYQKMLTQKSVGTVEWTTSDQLEHLIQHPTEYGIKMQSLLVQLRILSSRSCEAVNHFLEMYMGNSDLENMAYKGKYLELLDIYWGMLDTILLFQSSERGFWNRSVSVVSSLIETLSNVKNSNPRLLNLEVIKRSTSLILATDRLRLADRERESQTETSYSNTLFAFLKMLLGLPEQLLDDIWESLLQLSRHLGSNLQGPLLLVACKDYKNAHYSANIRLLLQLGANVRTADYCGNRPLHLVAQSDSEQSEAAGCLLLGYSATISYQQLWKDGS